MKNAGALTPASGGPVGESVTTLERDIGSEAYQQLLAAFLGYLSMQLAILRQAAAAGDVPAARSVAHQIKGTATSFGALSLDGLADCLLELETHHGELVAALVDRIADEVGRLQADFRQ